MSYLLTPDAQVLFEELYRVYEAQALDQPSDPVTLLNRVAGLASAKKWEKDVAFGFYLVVRWLSTGEINDDNLSRMLNIYVPRAARWVNKYGSRGTLGIFPKHDVQTYTNKIWKLFKDGNLTAVTPHVRK